MGDPEIYRKRADECAALAATTQSPQYKAVWAELEQHWHRLADALELSAQVDPFAAFLMASAAGSGRG
jgi:hypothetical protein